MLKAGNIVLTKHLCFIWSSWFESNIFWCNNNHLEYLEAYDLWWWYYIFSKFTT